MTAPLPLADDRLLRQVSEAHWQAQVERLLDLAGFDPGLTYHTHDSRRSRRGFPDLVSIRRDHPGFTLAVLELKTMTGKIAPAQQHWLDAWAAIAATVNGTSSRPILPGGHGTVRIVTGVWRPSDSARLWELLQEGRHV